LIRTGVLDPNWNFGVGAIWAFDWKTIGQMTLLLSHCTCERATSFAGVGHSGVIRWAPTEEESVAEILLISIVITLWAWCDMGTVCNRDY
jgi:hypothetical protein